MELDANSITTWLLTPGNLLMLGRRKNLQRNLQKNVGSQLSPPKPRTKGSFFNISGNYFSCKILKLNVKETKDDT